MSRTNWLIVLILRKRIEKGRLRCIFNPVLEEACLCSKALLHCERTTSHEGRWEGEGSQCM